MHYLGTHRGEATVAQVLGRLRDPAAWDWLDARVVSAAGGCWLRFDGPCPIELRVEVQETSNGIRIQLVEGALLEVDADVSVAPIDGGVALTVRLDLTFPVAVPGTLLRELDSELLPRWASNIVSA